MKLSGRAVTTEHCQILFGDPSLSFIDKWLRHISPPGSGIYILVDPNTRKYCLPIILEYSNRLKEAVILETEEGERAKTLTHAERLWKEMMRTASGRDTCLINLGGGVVTDLGGFVAAGFKRGVRYINIPTTLIGMVDASIGGKTAINVEEIKNQVGFFHSPSAVMIHPIFLKTLPGRELCSGIPEMIKTALIGDAGLWNRFRTKGMDGMVASPFPGKEWREWIFATVRIKNRIVRQDYRERKQRKSLNFGHTIGHALETWSHHTGQPLLHGEAIAAGLMIESDLSVKKAGLDPGVAQAIISFLQNYFKPVPHTPGIKKELIHLMGYDKKNRSGRIRFSLIRAPGVPVLNVACSEDDIEESFRT
jgi:3-dehydroquinate synthase